MEVVTKDRTRFVLLGAGRGISWHGRNYFRPSFELELSADMFCVSKGIERCYSRHARVSETPTRLVGSLKIGARGTGSKEEGI